MKTLLLLLLTTLGLLAQGAFPSPPHTLYGNVRDTLSGIIDDTEIEIVIFADGTEVGSAILVPHATLNENYRIEIPTMTGDPDMRLYTVKLREDGQLSFITPNPSSVFNFSPVPGNLTRVDFIQGNDIDMDGLPDDLELAQLSLLGLTDVTSFDPANDLDFDGLTNRQELIAGTIACDYDSQLNFKVTRTVADDWVEIFFDVVANRTYILEASTDVGIWTPVDMAANDVRANLSGSYTATSDLRLTVTTPPITGDGVFYRVQVR